MNKVYITGSGLWVPPNLITNAELVASYNEYVRRSNERNADAIARGEVAALPESSSEFIEKASGIKQRYVVEKTGVLDPDVMRPVIPQRPNDQISLMAEMAVGAAREALANAGRKAEEVDLVIVACSNLQRPYPAIAVEVQFALGCGGYGYDMNVACSSATFGIEQAANAVRSGSARCALVISPELPSGHLEWRDRDCHFIFGDIATAVVVEAAPSGSQKIRVGDTRLQGRHRLLQQHPQQQRLPRPLRSRHARQPRQAVHAGRAQGVQGSLPHGRRPHHRAPCRQRSCAKRCQSLLAAPGQPDHEPFDLETHPRPRRHAGRSARHPRQVRQHRLGRFHYRVPPAQHRPRGRERRCHLLVWGGVFDWESHPQASLTVLVTSFPWKSGKPP